jgi:hypothetical protein
MSAPQINPAFGSVLEPLGAGAGDFFLAASLYHAGKISFSAAAASAGLGFEEFHYRLKEHFGHGFIMDDETVLEDLRLADQLPQSTPASGSHAPEIVKVFSARLQKGTLPRAAACARALGADGQLHGQPAMVTVENRFKALCGPLNTDKT